MREAVTAYIGLGANLGDGQSSLRAALKALGSLPQVQLTQASSFYSSAPVDSSGPDYVNAVAELRTTLSAPALLAAMEIMEHAQGRQRPYRNAPRTLDLDLLLYGQATIKSPTLTVPHPRMYERAFVLVPLAQVAPDKVSAAQLQAVSAQPIGRIDQAN
jgi:2-amino-4-hydroxy-6-hydroxymethyldihydropteridine diphosphokinase